MQTGLNEWLIMDEQNIRFHMGQYDNPYRSTVKFLEFYMKELKKEETRYWI